MSRNYKFRAWHKTGGIMLHENSPGDALKWKNEGQNVEVMQYTGLKDNNGTEIYEGDVLRNNESIGVIVYEYDSFIIDWIVARDYYNEHLKRHNNQSVIIGNIYENPDHFITPVNDPTEVRKELYQKLDGGTKK